MRRNIGAQPFTRASRVRINLPRRWTGSSCYGWYTAGLAPLVLCASGRGFGMRRLNGSSRVSRVRLRYPFR